MFNYKNIPSQMSGLLLTLTVATAVPTVPELSPQAVAQPSNNTQNSPLPESAFPQSLTGKKTVIIQGSSSMATPNQALKERLETKYSGSQIQVETTTSNEALQALLEGKIDLAAVGRPLTWQEKKQQLVFVPIKREKIAIIIGTNNPFQSNLTFEQFARIFRGEITDWSQVGGPPGKIRLVDRPAYSDTRLALSTYDVFKKAPFQTGSTADPVSEDDTPTVIENLGSDGISYAVADQVMNLPNVRIVPMHKVLPSDPRYPYSQLRGYVYKQGAPFVLIPPPGTIPSDPSVPVTPTDNPATQTPAAVVSPPGATTPNPALPVTPTDNPTPQTPAAVVPLLGATTPDPATPVTPTDNSITTEGDFPWWLLLLLLFPLVGGLLWWLVKGSKGKPVAPVPPVPPTPPVTSLDPVAPVDPVPPVAPVPMGGLEDPVEPVPPVAPVPFSGLEEPAEPIPPVAPIPFSGLEEPVEPVPPVAPIPFSDSEEPAEPVPPVVPVPFSGLEEPVEPVPPVVPVPFSDSEEPVEPIPPVIPVPFSDSEDPVEPVPPVIPVPGIPVAPVIPETGELIVYAIWGNDEYEMQNLPNYTNKSDKPITLKIETEGTWSYGAPDPNHQFDLQVDGDGNEYMAEKEWQDNDLRYQRLKPAALVALKNGEVFISGKGPYEVTLQPCETLSFVINDEPGFYKDNTGQITVKWTVVQN